MTLCMCLFLCILLPTNREKRATVSDAAVMWAGRGSRGIEKKSKWKREVAEGCAEVADSKRKISSRGS